MKKTYTLLALALVSIITLAPIASRATILSNALNNAAPSTQTAVLQARITVLTTSMTAAETAVTKVNDTFQANPQFTSSEKQQMQQLTDTTETNLAKQIEAVSAATSNDQLDQLRTDTITSLKSYQDEAKKLIIQASTTAYETMITDAKTVISSIKALVPVFKAAGKDVTALQQQIDTCNADIDASNTVFYPALNNPTPSGVEAASKAIAKLGKDLNTLVQMADTLA